MPAIHLDTTVLVRLLVKDPLGQYERAAAYIAGQLDARVDVHVDNLALAEAYFVLQNFYGFSKADALAMLVALVRESQFVFSPVALAVLKTPDLATANPGFVDRLIHGAAQAAGATLVTFEKAAQKLPHTLVL